MANVISEQHMTATLKGLISEGLWKYVGKELEKGVSKSLNDKVMKEAVLKAADSELAAFIIPHCRQDQLESVLLELVARHKWQSVGVILQKGIGRSRQQWAIEEAMSKAGDPELATFIIPHCRQDMMESLFPEFVSNNKWQSVSTLLQRGIGTAQQHLTTEKAVMHASDSDFVKYILPHCSKDQLETALPKLDSRHMWQSVVTVLQREAAYSGPHKQEYIEEKHLSKHQLETKSMAEESFSEHQLETVLPELITRQLWLSASEVIERVRVSRRLYMLVLREAGKKEAELSREYSSYFEMVKSSSTSFTKHKEEEKIGDEEDAGASMRLSHSGQQETIVKSFAAMLVKPSQGKKDENEKKETEEVEEINVEEETEEEEEGEQDEEEEGGDNGVPYLCPQWQAKETFNSQGGDLQTDSSDVRLEIPTGAISTGKDTAVFGAVSINLSYIHDQLQLPEMESIVTPLAEYVTMPRVEFLEPVRIFLPHFLGPEFTVDDITLYEISGTSSNKYRKLKHRQSSDVWFELEEKHVVVYTRHFTGYVCTSCKQAPSPIELRLYSQMELSDGPERVVKLNLYAWDRRLVVTDFEKIINPCLNSESYLETLGSTSEDPSNFWLAAELKIRDVDVDNWMHHEYSQPLSVI